MRVLISGAGIAGPCLAFWLAKHGFEPTLVERAPALRAGGYVIDFWGAGFDVAERMGLLPEILSRGYKVRELRLVDRQGVPVGGFPVDAFGRLTAGRYISLPRSELAAALHGALPRAVETIFGDSIVSLEDVGGEVRVSFERAPSRAFDLVIGADGLHSKVRELAFGAEATFERYLGLKVAAFVADAYPHRDELVYVIHREVGRQVGRFAMKDDRTLFLFVWADESPALPEDLGPQKALLRKTFGSSGWECATILEALESEDALYMDRVSQIRLPAWTRGRIALVGDAAAAVSFLAGQGSALAMVEAYVLAGEIKRANGDHQAAFAKYQERLRPLIAAKQEVAPRLASFFAPRSRLGLFLQDQATKLMRIPSVASLTIGRELRDRIHLPSY